MIDEINTCLEETPFRCFCATFKCAENNLRKDTALFIYRRRIWPASIIDHFLNWRRIATIIIPVTRLIPGTYDEVVVKILYRSKDARKRMRMIQLDIKSIFESILFEHLEVASPNAKMPTIRPIRLVPLPENPRAWYE
ncbi:MAG: hypothetical protein Q7S57_00250 [bacterium]|nr:hypothetical protein [bacterium]